jgi:hypothetical protein
MDVHHSVLLQKVFWTYCYYHFGHRDVDMNSKMSLMVVVAVVVQWVLVDRLKLEHNFRE